MSGAALLSLNNLSVWYTAGHPVLSGLSLDLGEHEVVGLIGLNGAGKTTFIKTVAGLLPGYTELSKTAGSSPETVRKAFSELCRLGLIDKTRYGYFVTSNHGHISAYRQNYLVDLEKEYLVAKTKVCIVSDGEINPFKKDQ